MSEKKHPMNIQVGGDHYQKYPIQPLEFVYINKIPAIEASIIKYVTRHKDKGGVEDLRKARHFLDILIEFEYGGEE